MAAIDKLYIKNYWELEDLRDWALVYYPKLILYFYGGILQMSEETFNKQQLHLAEISYRCVQEIWENISSDNTLNSAIAYYITTGMEEKEAEELAREIYQDHCKSVNQLKQEEGIAVMNTPLKVDKKLKWICPVSCIREYLQKQCGVKEHWYYKLFWKGKKHFL